ncbi:MAG: hypothetical protein ACE5GX_10965 [Thermoanaerobaculia bacterium]
MQASTPSSVVSEVFVGEGHRHFLRRRLREISSGWTGRQADDAEVIAESVDDTFWELVGMRIRGHSTLILGAVQFRRQAAEEGHARQSLPSYLASDQAKDEVNGVVLPTVVALEFPSATESVQEFLQRLEGRSRQHRVLVEKRFIDVIFDLRAKNPSMAKLNDSARAVSQTVALRTRDGHLLSGNLLDLEVKLRRELPFIALTMGVQHTVHGNLPLPTVFLHRHYISMLAAADETGGLAEKLKCLPFQVTDANPLHLVLES